MKNGLGVKGYQNLLNLGWERGGKKGGEGRRRGERRGTGAAVTLKDCYVFTWVSWYQ